MGMLVYDALTLTHAAAIAKSRESVLTLGVPTLNFTEQDYRRAAAKAGVATPQGTFSGQADFFRMLGYRQIDALDISPYEGATIVGDLNDSRLAGTIGRTFDLVYDCGTLEHIFEVTTALRTINQLITHGGTVVHATPTNGFMDHGFWQVSPDLFRSFYRAEGYGLLTSTILTLGDSPFAFPAEKNIYRTLGRGFIARNLSEGIAVFAATKTGLSNTSVAMQDYYSQMHAEQPADYRMEFFIPYGSLRRAKMMSNPCLRHLLLTLRSIRNMVRSLHEK